MIAFLKKKNKKKKNPVIGQNHAFNQGTDGTYEIIQYACFRFVECPPNQFKVRSNLIVLDFKYFNPLQQT